MDIRSSIQDQKIQKRVQFQKKLSEWKGSDKSVVDYTEAFQWPKDSIISLYYPILSEIDLRFLHKKYPHIVYPRMRGSELEFVFSNPHEKRFIKKSLFYEPPEDSRVCAISDIDVFLVPALALDRRGARLGRGRGLYDQVLEKRSKKSQVIGVVWSIQVDTDFIPQEEQDENVDAILTEKYILFTSHFKKGECNGL